MGIDEQFYHLPLIGGGIRRLYGYFKRHTAFTDFIHVCVGVGIGIMIARDDLLLWGIVMLGVGMLGHLWAFIRGK